jgi:hypothetical protein
LFQLGGLDRGAGAEALPRRHHGAQDGRISAAAAQRVLERLPDLVFGGIRVRFEQRDGGQDLAGNAEAALDGAVVDKRLLQRMEPIPLGETLDREDPLAIRLESGQGTRQNRKAVEQDGAAAAFGFVAPDLGAG